MTVNKIKLIAIALFMLPVIAVAALVPQRQASAYSVREDAATTYKAKCAACHSPKAEKNFDAAKADDELTEIILKGKKGEKPPFMPGYEAKGMTQDQAKALVTYMKELRK